LLPIGPREKRLASPRLVRRRWTDARIAEGARKGATLLGVYADVVTPGRVRVGDSLQLP